MEYNPSWAYTVGAVASVTIMMLVIIAAVSALASCGHQQVPEAAQERVQCYVDASRWGDREMAKACPDGPCLASAEVLRQVEQRLRACDE